MDKQVFDFRGNTAKALENDQLRVNLKFAMDVMTRKRKEVFPDEVEIEKLRDIGQAARQRALSKLPDLLEQLEAKCLKNGIKVHWAETITEANLKVLEIVQKHKATRVIKGKSMVSEEMHLNSYLRKHGIESLETDLGEYIIQLAGETPSHIIVPAIHKNRQEIATVFHEKIPDTPYTEKVEELNSIARQTLRREFYRGEVGVSGVNMAVAETGTLCLVENEGNGRMCTTLPPVHIALMGLEKVVEKLEDLPPLLRLLTGSATGQLITTYVNMITSPRREGEKDGPKEVHLIILDNGRSKILTDPQLCQTLQCIRCGTCLNHCPVYTRIGGHAYGYIYPGPIGQILTPQMEGLKQTDGMVTASSLCNACEEVCPVRIPIPDLIRRLRNETKAKDGTLAGHGYDRRFVETAIWKGWELVNRHSMLNRFTVKVMGRLGTNIPKIGPLKKWTRFRTAPQFAKKTLHQLVKEEGIDNE